VKLDLGCGPNKREGFLGVDCRFIPGVDRICDLSKTPWTLRYWKTYKNGKSAIVPGDTPLEDDSVDEVYASHLVEHLTWPERVHFFNELHRVLKAGAKATIVIPHWASSRFYGDPTHKEPMSEFAFYYLLKSWRDANAPHTDYVCDFDATWGYSLHPALTTRNTDYQQNAIAWWKEACQDTIATLTKRA
jgi:SAM-dependent methyltransferase